MLVHAHPDDEAINNGATMAHYAARGAQVTLVTCTRGEEGEVLIPALAELASSREDRLGAHREVELAEAMAHLGVRDHLFLGAPDRIFRDSGMMGLPTNDRPDCFWQADVEEAAALLAALIDDRRPHVLITYDDFGGYGHPDHIQAHRVAMRAVELANWKVSKVYWNTMPRSIMEQAMAAMAETGTPFDDWGPLEDLPFLKPDEVVTTAIHAPDQVERKVAALRAHATQITVDGPIFALSNNLGQGVFGSEFYTLVRGQVGPDRGPDGWESDLFSGVDLS